MVQSCLWNIFLSYNKNSLNCAWFAVGIMHIFVQIRYKTSGQSDKCLPIWTTNGDSFYLKLWRIDQNLFPFYYILLHWRKIIPGVFYIVFVIELNTSQNIETTSYIGPWLYFDIIGRKSMSTKCKKKIQLQWKLCV